MEVQALTQSASLNTPAPLMLAGKESKYALQASLVERTLKDKPGSGQDRVSLDFKDLYKGLSVTAREIVDKINELLSEKLPNGVQSLKPEDTTPEATADRIVKGATAFFATYAKQNPQLEGEELVTSFMEQIRSGVQRGYDDAFATLKSLGAFDFEGVQSGVEQTKILIEEKLAAFESAKRKELGASQVQNASGQIAETELLAQAGVAVKVSAA
jgi:hypothetical protein